MKLNKSILYILSLTVLASCQPELSEDFEPSAGNADFSKYVALGNSLTAGFTDGALYKSAQEYSFGSILAAQFSYVGGGTFNQPLMPTDEGVGINVGPQGLSFSTKYVLGFKNDCLGETSLAPVLADPDASQDVLMQRLMTSVVNDGPFNNLGVPGIKSYHMLNAGLGLNPYFARMAQNPASDILIQMAVEQQPSFFSLWIGSNDVLGYAITGGTSDSITSGQTFSFVLNEILANLAAGQAKGAIANIPNIKVIPFFTTVPYNAIVLSDQAQVNALNAAYHDLNQMIKQQGSTDTIAFKPGANAMLIADASLPWGLRHIKASELVLLSIPQDSLKCAGWGTMSPVGDQFILAEEEIGQINAAVTAYNQAIAQMANDYDLALVDIHSELNYYNEHTVYHDGIAFNTDFITGNLFGLDGIHLSPRGNALIAMHFINAINHQFRANIPQVTIAAYPGYDFP